MEDVEGGNNTMYHIAGVSVGIPSAFSIIEGEEEIIVIKDVIMNQRETLYVPPVHTIELITGNNHTFTPSDISYHLIEGALGDVPPGEERTGYVLFSIGSRDEIEKENKLTVSWEIEEGTNIQWEIFPINVRPQELDFILPEG